MKLNIDNRTGHKTYTDFESSHFVQDEEIVKFVCDNTDSKGATDLDIKFLNICKLFVCTLELPKAERQCLTAIYWCEFNDKRMVQDEIVKAAVNFYGKSKTTYYRAINCLLDRHIIRCIPNGTIKVLDKYDIISNLDLDSAKFVVIELNPEITSAGINI